jgi:PadR family transcriptional regulator PadR
MADLETDIIRATVRGFSRALILWLITQEPMSGYGITKELRRLTGQSFHSGVVYPLLYELEENGLIAGKWVQKRRRRIKYYSITKEGTKLLNRLHKIFEMPVKEILEDFITRNG